MVHTLQKADGLNVKSGKDWRKSFLQTTYYYYKKIIITVILSHFDSAFSRSESLFGINKLWIRRKCFSIFCNIGLVDI